MSRAEDLKVLGIDVDTIRYARDWRYGRMLAPGDVEGNAESVWWYAFPTPEDRAEHARGKSRSGGHLDFLSEREIAVAIELGSREELWDYFAFADPEVRKSFLEDRVFGWYGKSDPRAKAPSGSGL